MEIKPLYDNTQTIELLNATPKVVNVSNKVKEDPKRLISNGIYRVISWEKIRIWIILILSMIGLIGTIAYIGIIYTYNSSWARYILPGALIIITAYKTIISLLEQKYLKKAVDQYREDLKASIADQTPQFIYKIYMAIHKKQIRQNWLTAFIMFYGTLVTLLLWLLKDTSWWIFEFDKWIRFVFVNPDLMVTLFIIGLISVVVLYIAMTIQRKRKILEIESYIGNAESIISSIEKSKTEMNKFYRRIFLLSIIIILLIPALIWIIFKRLRKK